MLRRWTSLTLALLALAAPPSARADDLADEADFRFRRGAELYAKRDYQGALDQFFTSNRLVHNHNVAFNIARTLEQLNRVEEAYRWYAGMLEEGVPESDRREVMGNLQRLAAKVALVRVESDTPGATIYVDRKDLGALGQTPRTLALPARASRIILELPGHYPAEHALTPVVGKQLRVKLALPTIFGKVVLAVTPPEATVRLDKEDAEAVASGAQVIPGRHLVFASAPGYVAQSLEVEVPPEGTATVHAQLLPRPPPTGALVVRANLDGALIVVDGKESGFTPGVVEGVAAGPHTVSILAEGREAFSRNVEVVANERSFVDAHLRYAGPSVEAATKSLARASDAPGSITVITREEIRAFGYQTLAEALRAVRGIFVSDDGTYTYLGFRGFALLGDFNNRILILVDGHAVFDPWVDQAYVGRDFDVDLDQVERIEVIRGGSSALYGAGAIFGVINVVRTVPPARAAADVEGGIGTPGEEHGRVTGSLGSERMSVLGTAALYDSSGEPVYQSPLPVDGQSLSVGNSGERAFHAGLQLRAGDFQLLAELNNRRKDSPTGQYDVVFGLPERSIDQVGFVEGRYAHGFGAGFVFTGRAYYDGSRFRGTYPTYGDSPGEVDLTQDTGGADAIGGELRLQLPPIVSNSVIVGVEALDRFHVYQASQTDGVYQLNDVGANALSEKIFSVFLNDQIVFSPRFAVFAGARLDDHVDSFGVEVSPRVAAIAHLYEGATTKLLLSRDFRAPSLYERFYGDGITEIPANNLQPELEQGVALEHTHPFTDEASVTGALFYNELTQLVFLGASPHDPGLVQYQNDPGTTQAYGAELEARYRPGPNLLLEAWYAYQHSRDQTGLPLVNSPANLAALRAMVPLVPELLNGATEVIYNSARYAPPDVDGNRDLVGEGVTWNVVFSGAYPRYHLRWQAGVFNLLDERVQLPAVFMPPGVNVVQIGRVMRLTLGFAF